ncbi:hypothetical protein BGX20_009516 [Mortierella sp. AD010]|nr:hypothetical protein BGX20_009516 [Mortierella sp. AD010]
MSSQKRQTNDIDISQKDVKRRSRAHIPDTNSADVNTDTISSYERITRGSNSDSSDDIVIKMEEENNLGPTETRNTLMWFRTDLRLKDNKALYEASMRSKVGGTDRYLIALFIISEEEWAEHDEAPIKIDFWMKNLTSLKRSLDELSIPLIVKTAKLKSDLVKMIESVVEEMDISHVFWNADLMVDEQRRDRAVRKALQRMNVHAEESGQTGNPYAVFTPYYNAWCKIVETESHYLELAGIPDANPPEAKVRYAEYFKLTPPTSHTHPLDTEEIKRLYPAGEEAAHERLNKFLETKAKDYHKCRDAPIQEGTSVMSPYLTSGVITNRQCLVAARKANKNKILSGDEGLKTWIKELAWKEFYKNILVSFPRVCMNRAFQPKTENIRWSENEEHFRRWCEGKTGFPIVDAGMRQLNSIGYMHNRLRMITACFLVKDLLIHWHQGETYFMKHLIDGDLASNNGGWQWVVFDIRHMIDYDNSLSGENCLTDLPPQEPMLNRTFVYSIRSYSRSGLIPKESLSENGFQSSKA